MKDKLEIIIRGYDPEIDSGYVYSTWTKYAWYSPTTPITTPKKEWFSEKIKYIKAALETSTVRVACFKDDPTSIVGYAVFKDGVQEWLCVKKYYIGSEIEKLLIGDRDGRNDDRKRQAGDSPNPSEGSEERNPSVEMPIPHSTK